MTEIIISEEVTNTVCDREEKAKILSAAIIVSYSGMAASFFMNDSAEIINGNLENRVYDSKLVSAFLRDCADFIENNY